MNYEKKYKEALEKAKKVHNRKDATDGGKLILESMFPELKESEDERIRKELIDAIQGLWDNDALPMPLTVKRKNNWIAWLEKQGEQKEMDYNEEFKKCITNPFYFIDKYVKVKAKLKE
jgi:hypothetical protein